MGSQKMNYSVHAGALYCVECYGADGALKWREVFRNMVVTEGRNTLLDRLLTPTPPSITWYIGLKGSGSVAAGDTMSSHPGWAELTPYSNANRPQYQYGTISGGSVDNSANKAVFNINASATVAGAFMTNNNTKGGTSGLLYGAGDFSASRSVINGDTLSVTVTLQIT